MTDTLPIVIAQLERDCAEAEREWLGGDHHPRMLLVDATVAWLLISAYRAAKERA